MRQIVLNKDWTLRQVDASQPLSTLRLADCDHLLIPHMPMQVADILYSTGKIESVILPGNAEKYRWIALMDWLYSTTFNLPESDFSWTLECQGLDLFADVYVNGVLIASANNALMPHVFEIPDYLLNHVQPNNLDILFHSTVRRINELIPKSEENSLAEKAKMLNLRKNRNDFGAYLGAKPYFVRMGIFGDVYLTTHGKGVIRRGILRSILNPNLEEGLLTLELCLELVHKGIISASLTFEGEVLELQEREVHGDYKGNLLFSVHKPTLWQPNGYGEPYLYHLSVQLQVDDEIVDEKLYQTGFRLVEMIKPLHFRINGRDIRLLGGNFACLDATTECYDEKKASDLLSLAKDGNYNTLRVWGPGSPLPEDFYQKADTLGLLIWQDFFSIYTGPDTEQRNNALEEAAFLVERLVHHPCILIWCGGNESMQFFAWRHGQMPMPGAEMLTHVLRKQVETIDPSRVYIPESPYGGYDHNDPRSWDTHSYSFFCYVPGMYFPNFVSEELRISPPMLRSCRRFMREEDIWPEGYQQVHVNGDTCEVPSTWIPYTSGKESCFRFGPMWEYYDAVDAQSIIHRVGIAAGEYTQKIIERIRRGRPSNTCEDVRLCGGYLTWKFNDAWPEIYGSKIDYFLEPNISYYTMKRAFESVLISFDIADEITVWICNDSPRNVSGKLNLELFSLQYNETVKDETVEVFVKAGEAKEVCSLTESFQTFRNHHILYAYLLDVGGIRVARANSYVAVERVITFPKCRLSLSINEGVLTVHTDKFAKCIYLQGDCEGDDFGWYFDDNYFSLLPNEEKRIEIKTNHKNGTIRAYEFFSRENSVCVPYVRK